MIKSNLNLAKKYKTRYHHLDTNEVLEKSHYLKNGKDITGRIYYLIGKDNWVIKFDVPEYREHVKNKLSCLEGFLSIIKRTITNRQKNLSKKGRFLIGNNEFDDGRDCYTKLRAHYNKQVEQYGPFCPITGQEFTFTRNNEKKEVGINPKISSNISPDRMLNPIHYTEQNLLFTTNGWNLLRGDFSLKDMNIYMPKPFFKNYKRILVERFPDQKYEVDQLPELENGEEHPQERR
jgi:hypothetical protein|tara:strand:- start:21 stop:722 length:702 start_codon:yes stop_codon:yes gene_type:complete